MRSTRFIKSAAIFGAALALGLSARVASAQKTVTFSSGVLNATAIFTDLGGGSLKIQLQDNYASPLSDQGSYLHTVFWDQTGQASALSTVGASAVVGPTSTVVPLSSGYAGPTAAGTNVGGEFAYAFSAGGLGVGAGANGISSAGLGIFGDGNLGGTSLFDPQAVDGSDFGLIGPGGANGSGGNVKTPQIQTEAVFILTGFSGSVDDITNVKFNFGTTFLPGVPEPMFYQLGALLGLGGIGMIRMRRKAAPKA